jgi:hypothetical protein
MINSIRRLDAWLRARRFRWRALFILFGVTAVLACASMFIDGGATALILCIFYFAFGLRYIRPNIR